MEDASPEAVASLGRVEFDGGSEDGEVSAVSLRDGSLAKRAVSLRGRGKNLGLGVATGAVLLLGSAGPAWAQSGAAPAASGSFGWAAAGMGLALGMRHALDPDHVVAVLNLIARAKGRWQGWRHGALWGLGHTLALIIAGGALISAKAAMPAPWAAALESLVALMLIGLGLAAMRRERRAADHGHYHDLERVSKAGARPVLVGLVHGLAGSGAVALLALAAVPGAAAGLAYLAMFGLGTLVGMSAVTFFLQALAVGLVADPKKRGRVALAAGLASAAFGAYMLAGLLPRLIGS